MQSELWRIVSAALRPDETMATCAARLLWAEALARGRSDRHAGQLMVSNHMTAYHWRRRLGVESTTFVGPERSRELIAEIYAAGMTYTAIARECEVTQFGLRAIAKGRRKRIYATTERALESLAADVRKRASA